MRISSWVTESVAPGQAGKLSMYHVASQDVDWPITARSDLSRSYSSGTSVPSLIDDTGTQSLSGTIKVTQFYVGKSARSGTRCSIEKSWVLTR